MSTTATWSDWAGNCTSSTATTSTGYDTVWYRWVDTGTATTSTMTTSASNAWVVWTSGSDHYVYQPKVESDEEKIARLERERAYAEQRRIESEKRTREAEERERKAYAFLLLCLDEKQKKDLEEKKHFELSVVGGRRYRINTGQSRNIQELDQSGQVKRTLCFHPKDNLHHYDAMAIQKLALECDEERALKVANFS